MTSKHETRMWNESLERLKKLSEPEPEREAEEAPPPAYPQVNDWGEIPVPRVDSEKELGKIKSQAERVRARARMLSNGAYHHSGKY